jgi:hypothetical protein
MSKVLITKEEKEALDIYLVEDDIQGDFDYFINEKESFIGKFKTLTRFTEEEFALVLLGHYTVASNIDLYDFQYGDLVVTKEGNRIKLDTPNMLEWAVEKRKDGEIIKIYPAQSVIED